MKRLCVALCLSAASCGGCGHDPAGACSVPADAVLCAGHHYECGTLDVEVCGQQRVIACGGECAAPAICGGGGTRGVCGVPESSRCDASWTWFSPEVPPFIYAVYGASRDDIWAAGDPGLRHWNGVVWSRVDVDGYLEVSLHALSGSSASDIWAAGIVRQPDWTFQDAMFHYDGLHWSRVPLPSSDWTNVDHVLALSPTNVWANTGVAIAQYDGARWKVVYRNGGTDLSGYFDGRISGRRPDDLWFTMGDRALHWNGARFDEYHPCPDYLSIDSIASRSPTDAWALCESDPPALTHFDGSRWTDSGTVAAGPLYSDGSVLYAAGYPYGPLLRNDGAGWAAIGGPPSMSVFGFGHVEDSGLWVFGFANGPRAGYVSFVQRLDGATWVPMEKGVSNSFFKAVTANGPNDAWACAEAEPPWQFDGVTWRPRPQDWPECSGVWSSSASDVWFITGKDATVRHWDGTQLKSYVLELPVGSALRSIAGCAPNDIWVVGATSGELISDSLGILGRWDGSHWTTSIRQDANGLDVVSCASDRDVWAAGPAVDQSGIIWSALLHWDGTGWVSYSGPMGGPSALVVTHNGLALAGFHWAESYIYRWNGTGWQPEENAPMVLSLCADESGTVWGAGWGLIRRDPNGTWSSEPTGPTVLTACAVRDGSGWAVGDLGQLLRTCR